MTSTNSVHVQCCEIYNGAIRDLLEPESRGLKVGHFT